MSSVKLVRDNKNTGKTDRRKKEVLSDIKDKKVDVAVSILFWILIAVYGGLCFYLYYKQSIQPAVKDNSVKLFESDLPFHISMVVDDGWYYSITALIYLVLYNIAGKTTVLIAVFLAAVSVGTVVVTERILHAMGIQKKVISCGGAIILNLLMPFYVKWAGMYRYVSYQSGNVWHNSTYQCMKLVALICMLLFIKWNKKILKEGITVRSWIVFALTLTVCTGIKPSFLTVFAPAFAVKLLINWLKDKTPFKNVLLWEFT